jgi:polysaccharide export outer membrane protein
VSQRRNGSIRTVERELAPVIEALIEGGTPVGVPVRGRSMEPTLLDGDQVVVAPFLGLPRPGQLVLAQQNGIVVAHRLIEVILDNGRRHYRLQGDAEAAPDAPVLREAILGRVVEVVRDGLRVPIDDSPEALRRALFRLALKRRRPRLVRRAAVFLLATLCALTGGRAAVVAPSPEQGYAPAADYRFAPGDILSLRIWDGEKLDEKQLTVQSDGTAFLPILGFGSLELGGRTAPEAKQEIESRLGKIYKEIYTELLVMRYAGHRVNLMGEVRTTSRTDSGPGEWPLAGPTRLVTFLSEHGGPTPDADLMRVQVVAHDGVTTEVNLFRAVFQQSAADNPMLGDGDFVYLPSLAMGNRKVFVLGDVSRPGVVPIYDKMSLVEAIANAGGIVRHGNPTEVAVIRRRADGQPDMQVADLKNLFKTGNLKDNLSLSPGDIVFVPRGALGTLQDIFTVISPALDTIESLYIINNFRKN